MTLEWQVSLGNILTMVMTIIGMVIGFARLSAQMEARLRNVEDWVKKHDGIVDEIRLNLVKIVTLTEVLDRRVSKMESIDIRRPSSSRERSSS